MSVRETELAAYHDSRHAVVRRFLTHHDPVHKITIIRHGLCVGSTRFLATEDRSYLAGQYFRVAVVAALGGNGRLRRGEHWLGR